MIQHGPSAREPVPAERPTSRADLKILVSPALPGETAKGRGPLDRAMSGIGGSAVTGTAGAVLTLRIAPGLTGLAMAELILALAIAVLIAACGLAGERAGRRGNRRKGAT